MHFSTSGAPLKPEERARQKIDQLLEAAGWIVQSRQNLNLGSGMGIALRELPSPTGPADYWLFVNLVLCWLFVTKSPPGLAEFDFFCSFSGHDARSE